MPAEVVALAQRQPRRAPHLLSLLLFHRYVRRWAIHEMVTPTLPADRAAAVTQWTRVLQLCADVRNYECAIAVLEALRCGRLCTRVFCASHTDRG
jgi:hypothetical protein